MTAVDRQRTTVRKVRRSSLSTEVGRGHERDDAGGPRLPRGKPDDHRVPAGAGARRSVGRLRHGRAGPGPASGAGTAASRPLVQAAVLGGLAWVVLAFAGVVPGDWTTGVAWLVWIPVVVAAVSVAMNAASRSPGERRIWVPVGLVLLGSSAGRRADRLVAQQGLPAGLSGGGLTGSVQRASLHSAIAEW